MADPFLNLTHFLLHEVGCINATMQANLVTAGFDDLQALVRHDDKYVGNVCYQVRKGQGEAAHKEVPVSVEMNLKMAAILNRYLYMTPVQQDPSHRRSH